MSTWEAVESELLAQARRDLRAARELLRSQHAAIVEWQGIAARLEAERDALRAQLEARKRQEAPAGQARQS